jgi:NAD(P)-dependent dehydrogenase (short-subunit alcohol dehydrogenase family)
MAYADLALELGDNVVLTARRPHLLEEWAARHGDRVLVHALDVTDAGRIHDSVRAAEERFGGIDVLVNNAGQGWYGSVEGTPDTDVRASFELNFFSVAEMLRAVLPGMRKRGDGWIVNMSSIAGLRSVPGFGYYSAAKYAIEGLTDALRHEVAPFGIKVLAVEPGAFRTNAYSSFADERVSETVDAYVPLIESIRSSMIGQDGRQAGDPYRGVRTVVEAMNSASPPRRIVLGADGYEAVLGQLSEMTAELRAYEAASRSADFPAHS